MTIIPTKRYTKSFIKLTKYNKELGYKVISTLENFKSNPDYPSLRLHKLANTNFWSISVNMSIRIVLSYEDVGVVLIDIGDHSIYD